MTAAGNKNNKAKCAQYKAAGTRLKNKARNIAKAHYQEIKAAEKRAKRAH